jgi:copper chaperone CopZ
MPKCFLHLAFIALLASSFMAAAEERKTVLHVENMFCSLCEATVSRAIGGVPGVVAVEVDRDAQVAAVVYDDDLASPEDLAAAATAAGYPASPAK